MWILLYLLPGFGVGGTLTWLLLLFTPLAGDWWTILVVGGLAGGVWTLWQSRRRERRRLRRLALPPEKWRHGDEVVVRGKLVCLEAPLRTPVGGDPAALYGYDVVWRSYERTTSSSSGNSPTQQAEGYAMTICAVEADGRQFPLRGMPDTGATQWRTFTKPVDLERLCRYWIENGIRTHETGLDVALEYARQVRKQLKHGRLPEFAGLGMVRRDNVSPLSDAGKHLKSVLGVEGAAPDAAELAGLLHRHQCKVHEECIEPGAEVVVVGTWNAASNWIETGSTSAVQPGDRLHSGKAKLRSKTGQALIRLAGRGAPPLAAQGNGPMIAMAALLLAVVAPLAWFVAPLATPSPRFQGHLSVVDLVLVVAGDLEPLKVKLLEPPVPPAHLAHYRARLDAGEDIPEHWKWRLQAQAEHERLPAELRARMLERVLETLRPDLNQLGGEALAGLYSSRSIGRSLLLDTRGVSLDLLLRHGADPNLATEQGQTALLDAADRCDGARIERLLAAGADPNRYRSAVDASTGNLVARGTRAASPFVDDCRRSTQLLVAAGGRGGTRAVLSAVRNRDRETLAWLLQAGVDRDEDDPDYGSPLETAVFAHRNAEDEAERADHEHAMALLRAAGARPWQATAANGHPFGTEHPAAQALQDAYRAIQTRDEAAILRLYPGHGRWRAGRSAEDLADFHQREPLPPFEVSGFANDRLATVRFRGKRADGSGFDWYAQMVYRQADDDRPAGWTIRRRWGGEPRPF